MDASKRILGAVRRAVTDYGMIEEGDRIAVGVSAGKDSLTLLYALSVLQKFYPNHFTLHAVTVDMGFHPSVDFSPVADFCRGLGVPFTTVPTEIYDVVFTVRKEPNPCSLCAKMRRGALYGAAAELGCNKVALGHHFDDAVHTFLLNLFYEGRLGCFSPVTYLDRQNVTLIRPLLYAEEEDIRYFVSNASVPLPVISSPCPADGNTERAEMQKLVKSLERNNKGLRHRIFLAMQSRNVDGMKPTTQENH